MIVLYFIISSVIGVSFFYLADYFLTKWERKNFVKHIHRDNKKHDESSTF